MKKRSNLLIKFQSFDKNSFISGITFVGLPTEVYSFGIQYLYISFGVLLMGFFMSTFYLPVFHELNITSTYEVRNKS